MGAELPTEKPQPAPSTPTPFLPEIMGPGKTNPSEKPTGGDQPGKLNPLDSREGQADARRESRERTAAVGTVAEAAASGDFEGLKASLKTAYEKFGGDPEKFKKFGAELAKSLKEDGIEVKFGKNSVSFHKDGERLGVDMQLDAQLNPKNGKLEATVKAQPYDYKTKRDVENENPENIVKAMGAKGTKDALKFKTPEEIGKAWDEAFKNKDFSGMNKDLSAAFEAAYKKGGMDAVRKLEKEANDKTDTPNAGPMVIEDKGKLRVLNGKQLTGDAKELAKEMTAEQLEKAGIVTHPKAGFVKILSEAPSIPLKEDAVPDAIPEPKLSSVNPPRGGNIVSIGANQQSRFESQVASSDSDSGSPLVNPDVLAYLAANRAELRRRVSGS